MSDEPKVVSLYGGEPSPQGECSEVLIEFLVDQLERARSGDVIGYAGVTINSRHHTSYHVVGFADGYATIGGLEAAKADLLRHMMSDED